MRNDWKVREEQGVTVFTKECGLIFGVSLIFELVRNDDDEYTTASISIVDDDGNSYDYLDIDADGDSKKVVFEMEASAKTLISKHVQRMNENVGEFIGNNYDPISYALLEDEDKDF